MTLEIKDLSPDQLEVFNAITAWSRHNEMSQPIMTFGGFAGTGKTTVLSVFAQHGPEPIAFCAYTGKAASILKRKLLQNNIQTRSRVLNSNDEDGPANYYETDSIAQARPYAGTIHGLIYQPITDKTTGRVKDWEKRETLDCDYKLIVVDEASMVSDMMMSDLRNYGIPILMVGDHGQLPPVGGSGSLMQRPNLRLEKIHRQAEGNPIIKLSAEVRKTGRFDRKLEDGEHIFFKPMVSLRPTLIKRYKSLAGDELFKLTTLCYTNKRRAGTNQLTRQVLGLNGPPKVGELVICLKNDRSKGVYNGMRGLVMRDQGRSNQWPWQIQAEVDFQEDSVKANVTMCAQQFGRDKTFGDYEELEKAILETSGSNINIYNWGMVGGLYDFAYCATTHKFQGSSVDDVLLIAERPGPVDEDTWRRWKYTSITRAVHRLTIIE